MGATTASDPSADPASSIHIPPRTGRRLRAEGHDRASLRRPRADAEAHPPRTRAQGRSTRRQRTTHGRRHDLAGAAPAGRARGSQRPDRAGRWKRRRRGCQHERRDERRMARQPGARGRAPSPARYQRRRADLASRQRRARKKRTRRRHHPERFLVTRRGRQRVVRADDGTQRGRAHDTARRGIGGGGGRPDTG